MTPPQLLIRAPQTHLLPTELLLEIFSRVAHLHPDPSTLNKLTAVNHEWRSTFQTYGETLWRIATLSAFPGAYFSCPRTEVSLPLPLLTKMETGGDGGCGEYWRETFLIHYGWATRRAYTTVVVAPGPPPVESSSSSLSSPDSGFQATTPLGEHAVQDTVMVAVDSSTVSSASAPAVVVSIHEATALFVHAGAEAAAAVGSSSTTMQGHYHQHQHHHHIHDHHLLMDQHHQHQPFLDPMHRESSTATNNAHSYEEQQQHQHACASNIPRISLPPPPPAALLLPTDGHDTEILSCSLCTYSDICLIPQAKICVRTYRTRTGGPLMQVLDWSMRHSLDLGLRRRDVRDDDETGEEIAEGDSDEESNGETTQVGAEVEEGHQDLISGMAVNEAGTLLVSCSIDGTVRVWDVLVAEFGGLLLPGSCDLKGKGKGAAAAAAVVDTGFLEKVEKYGCPVQARRVLNGHVGWVNTVAIEDTTVVSGGSDHTVRIWDALTGQLLRRISDLFTTRDLDLGVFTVAIHKTSTDSIIGVGSVVEGYQLYSLSTGELLMDLDEPLTSRQHNEFEDEVYQQYAAKIEITETVVVTNAKVRGMLCVWCRWTGELLYRIRVCPSPISPFSCSPPSSTPPFDQREGERQRQRQELSKRSRKMTRMVSLGLSESSRMSWRPRRLQEEENSNEVEEDEETVHTFKVSRSGSMLMCTLCDGRVALFEFGSRRSQVNTTKEEKVQEENEVMVVLGDSCDSRFGLRISGAVLEAGGDQQQQQQQQAEQNQAQVGGHQPISSEIASVAGGNEGDDEDGHFVCNGSALAWIWSRDRRLGVSHQHQQRVILV